MMEVANSIMLYGYEILAETLLVLACTFPVDILAAERLEIYKAKSTGNYTSLQRKYHCNDDGSRRVLVFSVLAY